MNKQKYQEIKDKQICRFIPENITLVQYKIADCIISVFKKKPLIKSTKVIYYFCGYNDYFFHYHMLKEDFDIVVIDIPGFGFNKEYDHHNNMNIYSEGKFFNYYDDISQIVKKLNSVFEILANDPNFNFKNIYTNHYIYGHSTGGHIILSYISESKNPPITFNRILLNSPLTRFYFPPIKVPVLNFNLDFNNFLYYSIKILGLFSKNIDLQAIFFGKNSDISEFIKMTNDLIINIEKTNQIDLRFKSNISQPKLFGWINCVHSQTQKMINNKKKIQIPTVLICSKSYGSNTYGSNTYGSNTTNAYNHDESLNPEFSCEDIKKIICDKNENLKVYQMNTGHDIMLEPNNDNDKEYWETYFELMFNQNIITL
jgi:alpha-beta hydrolase superfamily lysophospholipase